ncbi:MAG TPA: chorismate mutase [Intrasporangium sp.]|nr:chorismate mutase [Intrasporangium sp.]
MSTEIPAELADLRRSIDNIDAAIIHMLAERFRCTQKVGVLKARKNLPPADPAREEQQIARLRALAHDAGLDPVFAEKFLAFVIAEVIHHHERIAAAEPGEADPTVLDTGVVAQPGASGDTRP